jgi:hypothetical protein
VEWEVAALTREGDYHVKEYNIYTPSEREYPNEETEELLIWFYHFRLYVLGDEKFVRVRENQPTQVEKFKYHSHPCD